MFENCAFCTVFNGFAALGGILAAWCGGFCREFTPIGVDGSPLQEWTVHTYRSGQFTPVGPDSPHNTEFREWNYAIMKSGKEFTDTNTVSDIIQSFPKAKYVPLRDFMMEPSHRFFGKR